MRMLAIYDDAARAAGALAAARRAGFTDVTARAPAPDHELEQAAGAGVSPVRTFVLVGALLGCAAGFALPIYTVYDWPLITGGKALVSIPPFVVIAFELTILFGAIGGMIGFLLLARLPRVTPSGLTDARLTNDCVGVAIACADGQAAAARAALDGAGPIEVRTDG